MPAHEPPARKPETDRDIDQDVDVLLDDAGKDGPAGPAFDADAPAPPFRPPVPGAHLTLDELEDDLETPAQHD